MYIQVQITLKQQEGTPKGSLSLKGPPSSAARLNLFFLTTNSNKGWNLPRLCCVHLKPCLPRKSKCKEKTFGNYEQMPSTWQDVHTTAYMCSSETTQVCCDIKFWQYFNNFRYMFEDRVAPNPSKSSEPTSYETYHLPVCDQTWLAGKSLRQMEVFSCEQLRTKWWILQPLFHVAPMECLAWCSNKPWPWHAMAKVWHLASSPPGKARNRGVGWS